MDDITESGRDCVPGNDQREARCRTTRRCRKCGEPLPESTWAYYCGGCAEAARAESAEPDVDLIEDVDDEEL